MGLIIAAAQGFGTRRLASSALGLVLGLPAQRSRAFNETSWTTAGAGTCTCRTDVDVSAADAHDSALKAARAAAAASMRCRLEVCR